MQINVGRDSSPGRVFRHVCPPRTSGFPTAAPTGTHCLSGCRAPPGLSSALTAYHRLPPPPRTTILDGSTSPYPSQPSRLVAKARPSNPNTGAPDLHGKVNVVTRGSAGIGFGIFAQLLQRRNASTSWASRKRLTRPPSSPADVQRIGAPTPRPPGPGSDRPRRGAASSRPPPSRRPPESPTPASVSTSQFHDASARPARQR